MGEFVPGGSSHKKTLYIGGLEESVDESILHAAFIPFGEVTHVQIPFDDKTNVHRGFGFVTFELIEDAKAALDNMHHSEIFGRTLKVNIAKPQLADQFKPIWQDATYYERHISEQKEQKEKKEQEQSQRATQLTEELENPEERSTGE